MPFWAHHWYWQYFNTRPEVLDALFSQNNPYIKSKPTIITPDLNAPAVSSVQRFAHMLCQSGVWTVSFPRDVATFWQLSDTWQTGQQYLLSFEHSEFVMKLEFSFMQIILKYTQEGHILNITEKCVTIQSWIAFEKLFGGYKRTGTKYNIIHKAYVCLYETWSFTLSEERSLRMFENRVQRRTFGRKGTR